ncbi:iroquois-class homeodomain protein IRX-6 isoform X2 [Motacilla alba alba]|uniref:iroquois-class homeodomain protein IRX-6 isoform X2 n=1 Tax=Motacilla alba alba TaxID=1094192 RepID=UPI0018D5353F|nr:iroquois-class homeodomain protein IRX-6 isoform X2 [Motacilla alba alba]
MSFSQFGYPYSTTSQFFVPASPSTTCCEAAPRSGPDASSAPAAASLCCAPYESRLLAPGRAELNAALGMYSAPYAAGQGYGNYLPYGAEPAALYTALNPQYEIKDGAGSLHSGIAQPATYYSYDHSLGQYQYDRYGTVDFGGSARRKNATRETTSTLKTWLRRLKKENKMTWSPKNKAGEERKEETSREEDEYSAEGEGREQKSYKEDKDLRFSDLEEEEEEEEEEAGKPEKGRTSSLQEAPSLGAALPEAPRSDCSLPGPFHAFPCAKAPAADFAPASLAGPPPPYAPAEKPRIWSLARTAGASAARRGSPEGRGAEGGGGAAGEQPLPAKAFRSSAFNLQPLPRSCASHRGLGEPCQFAAAGEGFGRGAKGGPGGTELGGTCLDRLRTAFRPVLRRAARPILGAGDGAPAVTKHSARRSERNLSPGRRGPRGSACPALAGEGPPRHSVLRTWGRAPRRAERPQDRRLPAARLPCVRYCPLTSLQKGRKTPTLIFSLPSPPPPPPRRGLFLLFLPNLRSLLSALLCQGAPVRSCSAPSQGGEGGEAAQVTPDCFFPVSVHR